LIIYLFTVFCLPFTYWCQSRWWNW